MKDVDVKLINQIASDVKSGKLRLPSPPEFAQNLHEAIADERRDISYVARIIQYDPGLTTRIIEIANSPLFRGKNEVVSCQSAVTRIGMMTTRHYVYAFTLNNAFKSKNEFVNNKIREAWDDSRKIAILSFIIAEKISGMDPHRALMAGLVHNIGALPLLLYAEKSPSLLNDPSRLTMLIDKVNAKLGTFVLTKWKFDKELSSIPSEIDDWCRDPKPDADYADIVNIARIYNAVGKPEFSEIPKMKDLPSFKKMPFSDKGPEACIETLKDAEMEMSVVMALL